MRIMPIPQRKREDSRRNSALFTTLWVVLLGIVAALFSAPALAVDANGVFELDANALEEGMPGDDWETLKADGGSQTEFTFIDDKVPGEDDNIFTGGKSKTPEDPEDWLWKGSPPPPDKDNIHNAYAANYRVAGEQILYFGADLFAANGDAELAYWFFQERVTANGLGGFDGHHKDGDVYIASKYSNGGRNAHVAVYMWDSSCGKAVKDPGANDCAAKNIRVVIPEGPALCNGAGGDACAITNEVDAISPWAYMPKSGSEKVFPPTTFFEGGINITSVFGGNKCFASFMATTGASTSFTSTAKDFALKDFGVCSVDVSKVCTNDLTTDDTPTNITYNVRGCGINDGGAPINLTTLLNSIGGQPQVIPADLEWYIPGQVNDGGLRDFDPATDCSNEDRLRNAVDNGVPVTDLASTDLLEGEALVYQFSESGPINGPTDTVTLDAEGVYGAEVDADTATAQCPPRAFKASMKVTKVCAANLEDAGSNVVVKIDVEGIVCNEGEVKLTDLTLADQLITEDAHLVSLSTTLEAGVPARTDGKDCTTYTGYYYPSSIPSGTMCPFMDQVQATAVTPINSEGDNCLGNTDPNKPGTLVCTAMSNSATCNLRVTGDPDCSTGPWTK